MVYQVAFLCFLSQVGDKDDHLKKNKSKSSSVEKEVGTSIRVSQVFACDEGVSLAVDMTRQLCYIIAIYLVRAKLRELALTVFR